MTETRFAPSLTVPAGWTSGFLPGADLVTLPLGVPDITNPTFVVRSWAAEPLGGIRTDPRRPAEGEDLVVGQDRWSGGHWFGHRFIRLVRSLAGRPLAEIRWLLWPVTVTHVDLEHGDPVLDVTATTDVVNLSLLEPLFDGMATDIRAGWSPALPASVQSFRKTYGVRTRPVVEDGANSSRPWAQSREARDVEAQDAGTGDRHGTGQLPGRWRGTGLIEIPRENVADLSTPAVATSWGLLRGTGPGEGVGAIQTMDSRLKDASGTRLTDRAREAGRILADPHLSSELTVLDASGRRSVLHLRQRDGLAVAVVPHREDTVLFGLFPAERSAELVLRAAGLGPTDSRALTPEPVHRDLLFRRLTVPSTPIPQELTTSAGWARWWSEDLSLWTLTTTDRPPLMAVSAGRRDLQMIFGPEGEGDADHRESVRLAPVQTSRLLSILLTRFAVPGAPASGV